MTSERKADANRRNGRKSRGPRTAAGRERVSRNALRHGLDSAAFDQGSQPEKIERIARLIAGGGTGGIRYEQAVIIAESSMMLFRIRLYRVKAIERFRERLPSPFNAGSPLPQEIDGLERHYRLGNVGAVRDIMRRWVKATVAGGKEFKASVKEMRRGNLSRMIAFGATFEKGSAKPRTDVECLLLALAEIQALERYERRALSRRRRAVRIFDELNAFAHCGGKYTGEN
jgi:hypothetical protein